MRLLLHFARFGPYHHARLQSAAEGLAPHGWEVIGLETASADATYAWDESLPAGEGATGKVKIKTVFAGRLLEDLSAAELRAGLSDALAALAPDVVAVAGWGSVDARLLLTWCRKNRVKVIVMSETREADGKRVWWKERWKSWLLRSVHGALVGGASHREYLVKLGVPRDRIQTGYNVVDNVYFAAEAARWRVMDGLPSVASAKEAPYFLASNRFIERKNLERLIDAYALCCQQPSSYCPLPTANCPLPTAPWNLCLLGDGPLRSQLLSRCHELGLNVVESAPWENQESLHRPPVTAHRSPPTVFFPGFRQIGELPRFYAHAGAFVHPALEEPWGLVINEAMASGLPVLSGGNVGAAEELIEEGEAGWTFDATDLDAMTSAMTRLATLSEAERLAMGSRAAALLEKLCPTRAFGQGIRRLLTRGVGEVVARARGE